MIPRHKIHSLLAVALMLCMVAAAPLPSWASCKNSGGSSGSHRVGSQVVAGSVTICASAVSVTPARTATVPIKAKVIPKKITPIVSKLIPPVHRKPATAPTKTPAKPAKKIIAKQPAKTVPKTVVKTVPGSSSTAASSAMFTPAGVSASVFPSSELGLGQPANFLSNSNVHYRAGSVLNLPTEVRFTPVSITWILEGDVIGSGSTANYSFAEIGSHQVRVEVVYSVAYRVRGSASWINEPEQIAVTDEIDLRVSGNSEAMENPEPPPAKALLVGSNCLAKPASFGCR